MSENMFFIDYDPFAMDSRITVYENGEPTILSAHSDIVEMAEHLVSLTNQYSIYTIKIHATKNIFHELKRLTEEKEKDRYSENKIIMELC